MKAKSHTKFTFPCDYSIEFKQTLYVPYTSDGIELIRSCPLHGKECGRGVSNE